VPNLPFLEIKGKKNLNFVVEEEVQETTKETEIQTSKPVTEK
jgi:hypothetical protein